MNDFEERVLSEQADLSEKMQKLSTFMYGKVFPTLPAVDQGLLMVQYPQMEAYSVTISDRIERFNS